MKTFLKSAGLATALAVCATGLTVPGISHAQSSGHFSNIDLRGNYGFAFDGSLLSDSGPVPLAAVGQVRFSGGGTATDAVRTVDLGGTILHQTASGTYNVNPDGTGSAQFTVVTLDPPGIPDSTETFEFVLDGHGNVMQFISTTPGVVARGHLEQQDLGSQ